ncbi:hypothetical protein [Anthocerotibacter panamensis]|uniref:hypothetical protein n=1 Tax=Anthocerotibacter panamensis TaxID=2857077 RepID=UPI001C404A61|nr:hypothetical protein [Anthocerotibacter panamensis]
MHPEILEVLAQSAAAACWRNYQQTRHLPSVPATLEHFLQSCALKIQSPTIHDLLTLRTGQCFQALLLERQFNASTEPFILVDSGALWGMYLRVPPQLFSLRHQSRVTRGERYLRP